MSSEANDIRVLCSLPDHPKTKKLIRRLGPGAGWFLIRLWLWARDNRPTGDLTGMTSEDIELAIDWNGDNDAFVAELANVRLLDGAEGSYRLHDWSDHNAWSSGSQMRSLKAKWNAVKRHHGIHEADRQVPEYARIRASSMENDAGSKKSDASSTDAAMHVARPSIATSTNSDAPSPSPSPSPSLKDQEQVSTAAPSTDLLGEQVPPADLKAHRAQRLAQVARDAIETFNGSKLVKSNGGLVANISDSVGWEKRQQQVQRCIRVAREICVADYGGQMITREFWADYWGHCAADEHKSGRRGGGKDHPNWKPTFEYLTREGTMLEVYDRVANEDAA